MGNIAKRKNGRWLARVRHPWTGREVTKMFDRRRDGEAWITRMEAAKASGTWTDPATARMTVDAWCERWLANYATRRPGSVRLARRHVTRISREFGSRPLATVLPSDVEAWMAKLRGEGRKLSYMNALHSRLGQVFRAAMRDGIVTRSPCSRYTSPGSGRPRAYVATPAQVWALHDAMPDRLRAAVLLGAFAGLRSGEVCGLRPGDVDFTERMIRPQVQWPCEPLKTEVSYNAVPVPELLLDRLQTHMARWPAATVLTNTRGAQLSKNSLEEQWNKAKARAGVPDLRFHDLRHFYASGLIFSGLDIKTVQARLRHSSAKTTLDTYGHLWPDQDEPTRAAVEALFRGREA